MTWPIPLAAGQAVAISPWQTHFYRPVDATRPTLAAVLYIRPAWFLEASRRAQSSLRFGRVGVEVTDFLARMVYAVAQAMLDPDRDDPLIEDRICDLTQVAFDQSWQWTASGPAFTGPSLPKRDYRIRNALRLLQDRLGDALELDQVAHEVGLSRPHFLQAVPRAGGGDPQHLTERPADGAGDRAAVGHAERGQHHRAGPRVSPVRPAFRGFSSPTAWWPPATIAGRCMCSICPETPLFPSLTVGHR